ncbi:MAG TPA: hypothetical protein VLF19_05190 [Methylomirabilota bacterium]|nr:hypothetical protein [Methylomirabilota bacterium]
MILLAMALTLMLVGTGLSSPDIAAAQAVQHGAQPNPEEVRPANPDGDSPSAAAGSLRDTRERRILILGLPVNAVLLIAGVLVVLLLAAGAVLPRARRRERARGGGTFGRP